MNKYEPCPPVAISRIMANKLFKIIDIILSSFYIYQTKLNNLPRVSRIQLNSKLLKVSSTNKRS